MAKQTRKLQTKRKRYDHRELQSKMKEDPLIEALGTLTNFAKRWSQAIIAIVIVLGLTVAGVLIYRNYTTSQEVEASKILSRAQNFFADGDMEQAQSALDNLTKNYGSTDAAETGNLLVAQISYAQGNYNKAIEQYQDLARQYKGSLQNEIKFSLANAYQSKGEYGKALEIYAGLEAKPDFPRMYELYYMKGLALEEQGKLEKATEAYKQIPSDSESWFYGLAMDRIEWIKAEQASA